MQWTNFDPFILPKTATEIHVTLGPRGNFYLNSGAMMKLGDPVAVRLMFDKEAGMIGITAAPLKAKGAIELRAKYGEDSPGRTFRCTPFCNELGILPERTIMFRDPKIEDGVLILNINTTIPAPRRADPVEHRRYNSAEN
ncbi:MAG: hypothetical protein PSX80_03960 [bacterium]|nr:hypothetical protein [bacterium]